jgi:serine protease Do
MQRSIAHPVRLSNRSYTPPVTVRRLLSLAGGAACVLGLIGVSASASAQGASNKGKAQKAEAARNVGQAARALAQAADEVADTEFDAPAPPPESAVDRARQGLVLLERVGKPVGVGTVLAGDGRVLTALSPLGHGNDIDARYADGSVSRLKVGHTDRAWDLALLLPQNGRWKQGLRASKKSATDAGSALRTFSVMGQKALAPSRTIVKGTKTLLGGDNELLPDALEMASRFKTVDIGSPILDESGDVVGMIARACAPVPDQPCSSVPFGVPVSAIKAFLRTVPAHAVPPAPWLGIQGVADDTGAARGVRVLGVHPQSPAAAAGLRGGADKAKADLVVAVDGAPVTTPEALAQVINARAVGDNVQLLLFGGGKFRQVSLTLLASPDSVKGPAKRVAPVPKKRPRTPPTMVSPGY